MSVASPQNRDELKQYIKTKLGAPVLQINVSDEQMDLAINDAFQYFFERQHFDATERVYVSTQVTQELLDHFKSCAEETVGTTTFGTQNNFLTLPDGIIGVNQILSKNATSASGMGGIVPGIAMFNPFLTGGYGGGAGNLHFDLTSYYSMQQYLATLQWNMYPPLSYNYNKRTKRLFIASDNFNGVGVGSYLVFECDIKANADLFPDVWDDMFLKKLSTAYVQLAWGRVLTKYQQVQLPGGITMNGEQIYNDAKEEIANIQERFMLDYGDYPLDIVG